MCSRIDGGCCARHPESATPAGMALAVHARADDIILPASHGFEVAAFGVGVCLYFFGTLATGTSGSSRYVGRDRSSIAAAAENESRDRKRTAR